MMSHREPSKATSQQNSTVYVIQAQPQRTYDDVGGKKNISRMGIAFVALYDYQNDRIAVYSEAEVMACIDAITGAYRLVGCHLEKFVFPLLAGYQSFDLNRIERIDMLDEVSRKIGRKTELDDLLFSTLEIKRPTDPMKMARLFQHGQVEQVKETTIQIAKDLAAIYRHGKEKGYVFINGPFGQRWKISVAW